LIGASRPNRGVDIGSSGHPCASLEHLVGERNGGRHGDHDGRGPEPGRPRGNSGHALVTESRRWSDLAVDLESQSEAWESAERAADVAERVRLEAGRLRLVDRLQATGGGLVVLRLPGALAIRGLVRRVVSDAVVIEEDGGRECLVALGAVLTITGMGRLASAATDEGDSQVFARIGLRQLLRAIARDRSMCRVHLVDGSVLDGTIDRVGADYLDLAEHAPGEMRRRGQVRALCAVPLEAIVALRRHAD
jgi:hypothetical protein